MKEQRIIDFDADLQLESYTLKKIRQEFSLHFHDYYVIGYVEEGKRRFVCNDQEYYLDKDTIILINPFDKHLCAPIGNIELTYHGFNIKKEVMEKLLSGYDTKDLTKIRFNINVFNDEKLLVLLKDLHTNVLLDNCRRKKEKILNQTIQYLNKRYLYDLNNKANDNSSKIDVICKYIEKEYQSRITLDTLASLVSLNKYTLIRNFTKAMGITPYKYLDNLRITKARNLLESGLEPIEVAFRVGYVDQSHFTNHFKNIIGLTPAVYQRIFK